nr:unnamed protein product [Callosobruchus analis]
MDATEHNSVQLGLQRSVGVNFWQPVDSDVCDFSPMDLWKDTLQDVWVFHGTSRYIFNNHTDRLGVRKISYRVETIQKSWTDQERSNISSLRDMDLFHDTNHSATSWVGTVCQRGRQYQVSGFNGILSDFCLTK